MMKNLLCRWTLVLTLAILLPLSALADHREMAAYTYDQYKAFTFSWTDAAGVVHNTDVTEKATDPRHIIALLREVYTNPAIPGILHGGYLINKAGNIYAEGRAYYGAYINANVSIKSGSTTKTVKCNPYNITSCTAPTVEGYTVLIVEEKDSFTGGSDTDNSVRRKFWKSNTDYIVDEAGLIEYFDQCIASVQLLTNGVRVGTVDARTRGTMFSISGKYNRYFFISKGSGRGATVSNSLNGDVIKTTASGPTSASLLPFQQIFEQFSPVTEGGENLVDDYYVQLKNGDLQKVKHDCPSIVEYQHYFSMSGKSGTEAFDLSPLCFYLPDFRLSRWPTLSLYSSSSYSGTKPDAYRDKGSNYSNYNPDHAPAIFIYGVQVTATAERKEPASDHSYEVTLTWNTSYNSAGLEEEQTFYIYRVDADGHIDPTPVATVTSSTAAGNTWSETVEQDADSREVSYVVVGKPISAGFSDVTSDVQTITIPGYENDERMTLSLTDYESQYDYAKEQNHYANYLQLGNKSGSTAITSNLIASSDDAAHYPTTIALHRLTPGAEDGTADVVVATVTLTDKTASGCKYTIAYANQGAAAVDSKYGTKSGSLTFSGGVVDLSKIAFCDQFSASTATNEQSPRYNYQAKIDCAEEFVISETGVTPEVYGSVATSTTVGVHTYKTTSSLTPHGFSQSAIDADLSSDALLNTDNVKVSLGLSAINDDKLLYYTMWRDGAPTAQQAQRTSDGNYSVSDAEGPARQKKIPSGSQVVDLSLTDGEAGGSHDYVPVITTYSPKGNRNTYGCNILRTAPLDFAVDAFLQDMAQEVFTRIEDGSTLNCRTYQTGLEITPDCPAGLTPQFVRVWHDAPEVHEQMDGEGNVAYSYRLDQRQPARLYAHDNGHEPNPSETPERDFGASLNTGIWSDASFRLYDIFGAPDVLSVKPEGFNTTYTVRLYAKSTGSGMSTLRVKAEGDPGTSSYFVAEKKVSVIFNPSTDITTAIGQITTDGREGKVRYYNLQGQKSDKPFPGVNIVVTDSGKPSTGTKVLY